MDPAQGFLDSSHDRVVHCNASEIVERQWDKPDAHELLLMRKLADITYEVEDTLSSGDVDPNDLSVSQPLIHEASAHIRTALSEYIGHLFDEKSKMEQQLSSAASEAERGRVLALRDRIDVLITAEYVWNVAEIFWIDAFGHTQPIPTTVAFLEVMSKFRDSAPMDRGVRVGSDRYWASLYRHAVHGQLDEVAAELMASNELSGPSKKAVARLIAECPMVDVVDDDGGGGVQFVAAPKEAMLKWRHSVQVVLQRVSGQQRLSVLLRIFQGESSVIWDCVDGDWLEWVAGHCLFAAPWMDHCRSLGPLLAQKQSFAATPRGSTTWLFGAIMGGHFETVLYFADGAFPSWFSPHLCFLVRRLRGDSLVLQWPREPLIASHHGGDYNACISGRDRMTAMEWVMAGYVERALTTTPSAWLWLKHYAVFFERRGRQLIAAAMLSAAPIPNDRTAYLMLQTVDEVGAGDAVHDAVCQRMARQSLALRPPHFGRVAYWAARCRATDRPQLSFLRPLLSQFLRHPAAHIDSLHDVCDNGPCPDTDDADRRHPDDQRALRLLHRLRNLYLCRYDLQKVDGDHQHRLRLLDQSKERQSHSDRKHRREHPTPFSSGRGRLIDALSKPTNAKNKNLKRIADSFAISESDDDDDDDAFSTSAPAAVPAAEEVRYPTLSRDAVHRSHRQRHRDSGRSQRAQHSPDSDEFGPSPFPAAIIKKQDNSLAQRMSQQFLLQRLVTPPRPTPSRRKLNEHRTSSLRKRARKDTPSSSRGSPCTALSAQPKGFGLSLFGDDALSDDDDGGGESEAEGGTAEEGQRRYMTECCDIIASYVENLSSVIEGGLAEWGHFIRILLFSLPVLVHDYAPSAITVQQVLLVTHKWYEVKFRRDASKTGIRHFSKRHELQYIQQTLAHLQPKVLCKTYSVAALQTKPPRDDEKGDEEERVRSDSEAEDDDRNMIDID